MKIQERDELLTTLKTAIVGIEGSEETGIAGDVKIIKEQLVTLNGAVKTNTIYRKIFTGIGGTALLVIIPILLHLLGVY